MAYLKWYIVGITASAILPQVGKIRVLIHNYPWTN